MILGQPPNGLLICLLLCSCACICTAYTAVSAQETPDPEELQLELDALEAEIDEFRRLMDETKSRRSELEDSLERNEKNISEILNKIKQIQTKLSTGGDELSSLTRRQHKLLERKRIQQVYIARQIRASYRLGQQQYLKVVLNQEDPNQLARMMKYYDYFNLARLEQIDSYEELLETLDVVGLQIKAQNRLLRQQRTQLKEQQTGLLLVQDLKNQVLANLNREISETDAVIKNRLIDREHLESLLALILAGILNLAADDAIPFAAMRGNMFLPVAGKISQKFGAGRSEGVLRWQGLFIETDEGDPVHAIHHGRVVFSDWLRGFGLLLIISHGEGYMSLYGHNRVLYRQTGDWVVAGELVADVGNTGGQRQSGLYFEIRYAGKPSDPQLWCQARPLNRAA